jgi:hypothetical protein
MKLIHYGATSFDVSKFGQIKNLSYFSKPKGGLWASAVDSEYGWKQWCKEAQFRDCEDDNSFTFELSPDAKILVIDSRSDFDELPKVGNQLKVGDYLDFELLSSQYDAIHLTERGMWKTRMSLYGWDCECVLIMNSKIILNANN